MNTLQTSFALLDQDQLQRTWAFATRERRILSCSREAKILGIHTGMTYEDAKSLVPDMRILVIGGSRR